MSAFLAADALAQGKYYASPVAAVGHIYFASLDGKNTVVKAGGDKPEILHQTDFKERILATPALMSDNIYVAPTPNSTLSAANRATTHVKTVLGDRNSGVSKTTRSTDAAFSASEKQGLLRLILDDPAAFRVLQTRSWQSLPRRCRFRR